MIFEGNFPDEKIEMIFRSDERISFASFASLSGGVLTCGKKKEELEFCAKLDLPISSFDLSVRVANCLDAANVKTVRNLVRLDRTGASPLSPF